MRSQPSPVNFRIITLDQSDFLRSLVAQVVPLVVRVVLHAEGSTNPVGVDEADGYKVVLGIEVVPVRNGQGFVVDGVSDGTPDVDDTDPAFQEARSFVAEVTVNASNAGVVGLINVDSFLIYHGQFSVTSFSDPQQDLPLGHG